MQTDPNVKVTKMRARILGLLLISGLCVLINQAESSYAGLHVSGKGFWDYTAILDDSSFREMNLYVDCIKKCKKPVVRENLQLEEYKNKISKLGLQIKCLENQNQLEKNEKIRIEKKLSELKANFDSLEYENGLLRNEKINIEKINIELQVQRNNQMDNEKWLRENQINKTRQIEILEKNNELLRSKNSRIEENLLEVKTVLGHNIGNLENLNELLKTEIIMLKANLSESRELVEKLSPSGSNLIVQPSGICEIKLPQKTPFIAHCENDIAGPGWTVVQKRFDGSLDFYQNWHNYSLGFGNVEGEFFLGLQKIHCLTTHEPHEFYAHLEYFDGQIQFQHCKNFEVGSESNGFVLTVGECTASNDYDGILYHNGNKFSTYDSDNDLLKDGACAVRHHGGWWYGSCVGVNPNGKYDLQEDALNYGSFWKPYGKLKSVQLLIRSKSANTDN